jgi:hypothetical protein
VYPVQQLPRATRLALFLAGSLLTVFLPICRVSVTLYPGLRVVT